MIFKHKILIILCLFTFYQNSNSQTDSLGRFWSVGLIPYQLFSRSSAAYASYEVKRYRIEYRAAYAYPIYVDLGSLLPDHDRFLYKGWSHLLVLSYRSAVNIGVVAGIKYWRYENEWVSIDRISRLEPLENLKELRSAAKYGPVIGVQIEKPLQGKHLDWALFISSTITFFTGKVNFLQTNHPIYASSTVYPYSTPVHFTNANIAVGIRVGFKSRFGRKK